MAEAARFLQYHDRAPVERRDVTDELLLVGGEGELRAIAGAHELLAFVGGGEPRHHYDGVGGGYRRATGVAERLGRDVHHVEAAGAIADAGDGGDGVRRCDVAAPRVTEVDAVGKRPRHHDGGEGLECTPRAQRRAGPPEP